MVGGAHDADAHEEVEHEDDGGPSDATRDDDVWGHAAGDQKADA